MKPMVLAVLLLLPLPVMAQAEDTPPPTLEDSLGQLRDGAGALLRLFMQEMEPALQEMGPLLDRLSELSTSLPGYHPPEVLPNGDILLRRRTPEDTPDQDGPAPAPPAPEATPFEL